MHMQQALREVVQLRKGGRETRDGEGAGRNQSEGKARIYQMEMEMEMKTRRTTLRDGGRIGERRLPASLWESMGAKCIEIQGVGGRAKASIQLYLGK